MSRQRTLKPAWLDDEKLAAMSDRDRLVSVGLILLADDWGCGRASPALIRNRMWAYRVNPPSSRDTRDSLARLSKMGYLLFYRVRGQEYYSLPAWNRHQRIDKPSPTLRNPSPDDDGAELLGTWEESSRETSETPATPSRETGDTLVPERKGRDRSGRDRTIVTEDVPSRRTESKKAKVENAEAVGIATEFASLVAGRLPKSKAARNAEATIKAWADPIDKLHRIDGHGWDEIRKVLQWSQNDSFWSGNILSGAKLRKQFDVLTAQMNRPGSGAAMNPKNLTAADLFAMADSMENR